MSGLIHAPHWANPKVSLCLRINPGRILRAEEQEAERVACKKRIGELPRAARREILIAEGHPPDCQCSFACAVGVDERRRIERAIAKAEGR